MKRVLGIDFESTGLSTSLDRITEIGAVLWDVPTKRPLLMESRFLYDETYPEITPLITELTGITTDILKEFGAPPRSALQWLDDVCVKHGVEALVAHNGGSFDIPLLNTEITRNGVAARVIGGLPLIDTRYHLPVKEKPDSTKLKYMAADAGFLNPFSHRAAFDVLTMMKLFSQYDIKDILLEKDEPRIIVRAVVPGPWVDKGVGKDKARSCGYRWEDMDGKKFEKCWVKKIKRCDFNSEQKSMEGYQVIILE